MIQTRRDHETDDLLLAETGWRPTPYGLDNALVLAPSMATARNELAGVPRKAWRRVTSVEDIRGATSDTAVYVLLNGPWPRRSLDRRDALLDALQLRGIPQVEVDEVVGFHRAQGS